MHKPPESLYSLQKWFGTHIRRPLLEDGLNSAPVEPDEIEKRIAPSPYLSPIARLEIYNQQYWWRLQSTMKDHFPALLRLFGEGDFISLLVVPYLEMSHPSSWDLNHLGFDFPSYLEKNYHKEDRTLVLEMAKLDLSYLELFFAKEAPLFNKTEALYSEKMILSDSCRLFSWKYDLYNFRKSLMIEKSDHFLDHPFPTLEKGDFSFVLFRNSHFRIQGAKISFTEKKLLNSFKRPFTLEALCDKIEELSSQKMVEVEENLQKWVKEWIERGLIIPAKKRSSPSKRALKAADSLTIS